MLCISSDGAFGRQYGERIVAWTVAGAFFYFAIYRPEEEKRAASRKAAVIALERTDAPVGKGALRESQGGESDSRSS